MSLLALYLNCDPGQSSEAVTTDYNIRLAEMKSHTAIGVKHGELQPMKA